ncbi:MAG TPA: NADH-ubiquinone oxidoreductase-F iron-sulfur binding region domain-containing protein, partial [Mycobacterium sp.]
MSTPSSGAAGRHLGSLTLGPITIPYGVIGEARLLRGIEDAPQSFVRHLVVHGSLPRLSYPELLDVLDRAGLRGCGGAGYPVAKKLRDLRAGRTRAVVVNCAEGEPGSAKDHLLAARKPHLLLDGAVAVARAIRAKRIVVAVTDPHLFQILNTARKRWPESHQIQIRQVKPRYITGEGGALVSALSGGNGQPSARRPHLTERGLNGAPTLVYNAETCAQIALAVRAGFGPSSESTARATGGAVTALVTVSGAVAHPGVYEVPADVKLGDVMRVAGVDDPQAVVIGGYHGTWLDPDPHLSLSAEALAEAGASLGPGAIAFLGHDTCPLGELAAVAQWLAQESANQCSPCALGLPALADNLTALSNGVSDQPGIAATRQTADRIRGRGACAHPDGTTRFVLKGLAMLTDDIAAHQDHGGCSRPTKGHLALTRADALNSLTAPSTPNNHQILMSADPIRCKGTGLCAALLDAVTRDDQLEFPIIDQQQLAAVP